MQLQQFLQKYRLEKDLGKGSYGKVKLAINNDTGQKFACKFIAKSSLKKKSQVVRVNREIRLLKLLNHPNIIRLYDAIETEADIIIVTEYVPGGELFDYIQHRKEGLPEAEAMAIFSQVLSAVEYCHANCVVHRDLKPENLLFDASRRIKLIDFGFSNIFDPAAFSNTFCGSPYYAAPEVIEGKKYIGPEADLWSLGIILYILVSGRLPFVEDNLKNLCAKIKALDYAIPEWVSPPAADLIRRLLRLEQYDRISIDDIKRHAWLASTIDRFYLHAADIIPPRPIVTKVDEFLLRKLESYSLFPADSILRRIAADQESPQHACYYLLKERMIRETTPATALSAACAPLLSLQQKGEKPKHTSFHAAEQGGANFGVSAASRCSNVVIRAKLDTINFGGATAEANPETLVRFKRTANSVGPQSRKPDLELPVRLDVLVHDMTNALSKMPQVTSMSLNGLSFECTTEDLIFRVDVDKLDVASSTHSAPYAGFSACRNDSAACHSVVYVENVRGPTASFQEIRRSLIKHFV